MNVKYGRTALLVVLGVTACLFAVSTADSALAQCFPPPCYPPPACVPPSWCPPAYPPPVYPPPIYNPPACLPPVCPPPVYRPWCYLPQPVPQQGAAAEAGPQPVAGEDARATEPVDARAAEPAEASAAEPIGERAIVKKQQVCPVTGKPLGSMGEPYKVTVTGRDVLLCCRGCQSVFLGDPDKYLAKLDAPGR